MDGTQSPRVLDSLALAYFLSGEPGKAAGVLRKAIEALEEDADAGLREQLEQKFEKYKLAAQDAGIEVEDSV